VRIAIAQGRLAEAERWMTVLQNDHRGNATVRPTVEMVYARVLLAQGNIAGAQALLDAVLPQAATSGQEAYEIEICMLQALAWQAAGDIAHALETLASAVARAMPEGFIRLFLDEGAPMIALLRLLRDHRTTRPDVAGYCTKLLVAVGAEELPTLALGRTHPDLPEPLSAREWEVLDLLAEGYSNQEIANQLVVALSTIKTHVHHLYAKLQAPDRLRAVTRARALGLLDRGGDHDHQR
jgi:ATP/maltotriose-dependent transcriptional regulator MalT